MIFFYRYVFCRIPGLPESRPASANPLKRIGEFDVSSNPRMNPGVNALPIRYSLPGDPGEAMPSSLSRNRFMINSFGFAWHFPP